MSTESRELPEPLLDEVASWLPYDGDHKNIRERFAAFRSALAHSRAQDSGGEAAAWRYRDASQFGDTEWRYLDLRPLNTYAEIQPLYTAAEQPAKGEGLKIVGWQYCGERGLGLIVLDKATPEEWKTDGEHRPVYARTTTPQPSDPADAVKDVIWRIDNEASQFISKKGMIYLRYLRDLLATPPTAQRHDEGKRTDMVGIDSGVSVTRAPNGLIASVEVNGQTVLTSPADALAAHGAGAAVEAVASGIRMHVDREWSERQIARETGEEECSAGVTAASIYVECRTCDNCNHSGINDSASAQAACFNCDWSGPEPVEDKCPGCHSEGTMTASCPECGYRYTLIADKDVPVATPPQQRSEQVQGQNDGQ